MGRYTGKTCRLICMLSLTFSFFLVEIIVGYITNSLALVGDSYHMLSDVLALIVGFASVRISKWNSGKNTFGWVRAEVLGALVNSVFLLSLCFTIFVEALQRMFHNEEIHDPNLMLIVGGIGLGINLIGLVLFSGHGHSHGGHGHSHGGHSHGGHKTEETAELTKNKEAEYAVVSDSSRGSTQSDEEITEEIIDNVRVQKVKIASSAQLNMKGVFLHVLGDALGSVIVIISALVIKFVKGQWVYKVDPALSIALVIIILCTTIPLLRESALILLQTVPTHIQVKTLRKKLISKVSGVLDLHEFHIWQLAGNRIIATAHIRCQNIHDYQKIAEDIKTFFHEEGIHSTTMQLEFVETFGEDTSASQCLIEACVDSCHAMKCCKSSSKASKLCDMMLTSGVSEGSNHVDWVGNLSQAHSMDSIGHCGECTGLGKDPHMTKLSGASRYSPFTTRAMNRDLSTESCRDSNVDIDKIYLLQTGADHSSPNNPEPTRDSHQPFVPGGIKCSNECNRQHQSYQSNLDQSDIESYGLNPQLTAAQRYSSMYMTVSEGTPESSRENLQFCGVTEDNTIQVESAMDGEMPTSALQYQTASNTNNSNRNISDTGNLCDSTSDPLLQSRYLSLGQRPPLIRQDAIEIDETNNNA